MDKNSDIKNIKEKAREYDDEFEEENLYYKDGF